MRSRSEARWSYADHGSRKDEPERNDVMSGPRIDSLIDEMVYISTIININQLGEINLSFAPGLSSLAPFTPKSPGEAAHAGNASISDPASPLHHRVIQKISIYYERGSEGRKRWLSFPARRRVPTYGKDIYQFRKVISRELP
jgi:hypothetical protein